MDTDLLVRVKKSFSTPLGTLLNNMRTWLDHQGIQPVDFKPITLDSGLAFDVSFQSPQQAEFFRAEFGWISARPAAPRSAMEI